jgi:hypothetical protein
MPWARLALVDFNETTCIPGYYRERKPVRMIRMLRMPDVGIDTWRPPGRG